MKSPHLTCHRAPGPLREAASVTLEEAGGHHLGRSSRSAATARRGTERLGGGWPGAREVAGCTAPHCRGLLLRTQIRRHRQKDSSRAPPCPASEQ